MLEFDDDVMASGFHDSAPRWQIKNGGTYGIPLRALTVAGVENLLCAGMMITKDHRVQRLDNKWWKSKAKVPVNGSIRTFGNMT